MQWSYNQSRCTKTLDIEYSGTGLKTSQIAEDILGYATVKAGVGGGLYLSRVTPMVDDRWMLDHFDATFLYAIQISNGQFVFKNQGTSYKLLRVTVVYENPTHNILDDAALTTLDANGNPSEAGWERYCVVEQTPETQILTLPRQNLKLATVAGTPEYPYGATRVVPLSSIKVTWLAVPQRAVSSKIANPTLAGGNFYMDDYKGTVNSIAYNTFPAGTLLFQGGKLSPENSPFGLRTYKVELTWAENPQKWNYVYWPATGNYELLTRDGTNVADATDTAADGKRLYNARDHRKIMTPP